MDTIFTTLSTLGGVCGLISAAFVVFLRQSAQTYIDEKAKNMATIEDTARITREVEVVRNSIELESHYKKAIFEKEYQILQDVWKTVWDYQACVRGLRPFADYLPNDKQEQIKVFEQRYKTYQEKANAFIDVIVKNRPFIPVKIFEACESLRLTIIPILVDFEMTVGDTINRPDWKTIRDAGEKAEIQINNICSEIRSHLFP